MHHPDQSLSRTRALAQTAPDLRSLLWAGFMILVLGLFATVARAQEPGQEEVTSDGIIRSHGISTFGELKYPADFEHLEYVNPDAPKGGEFSMAWSQSGFDSLNPYSIRGRSALLSSIAHESLLTGTADEIDAAYGLLAESLEYPEDRSWVIFNLRPEARFSDGTPVTAEDLVFSYETLLEQGLPEFRVILAQQVESVEALGPHQVRYTFKEGWPTRDLPALVGGLPVFSRASFEAQDRNLEDSSMEPIIGSGPYMLDRVEVNRTIVYRRNPDYWGRDLPINVGQHNYDTIRVEYFGDTNAAFEGFKTGAYTFRTESSSLQWATGYDFPALREGHVVKEELPDGTLVSGQSFVFNLRREKFKDPRVREAIGLMFNFEWTNETLFSGLYSRVDSFWGNSDLAAEGPPSPEELAILEPLADLLPPGVLADDAVMPPVSGNRQLDRGNLRRASALLDEAGWTTGSDGLRRNAAGQVLQVEFLNDSQTFDRVINPFVENLRQLGVDAVNRRVDNAQRVNRERSYDFDITITHFPMSYIPSSGLKQFFDSASAENSTRNLMGLQSEAVDRLIDLVLEAESSDELRVRVRALDRVLRAERFRIPQWFNPNHWVSYYDMYEYPENLPPYDLGQLSFWWINQEKAQALRAAGALR